MMRRLLAKSLLVMVLLLLDAVLFPLPAADQPGPEQAAQQAAEVWLRLTDSRQYGASWDSASQLFRDGVTKEQWIRAITAVRGPLGLLQGRTLQSATHTRTLPGTPDGDYVILQYRASFQNKQNAVETITPMAEPDGRWRVSGYYIR